MGRANLTGRVFGGFVALRPGSDSRLPSGGLRTSWVCRCICGTEREIFTGNLTRGNSLSCGCRSKVTFGGLKICRSCNVGKPADEYDIGASGRIRQRCRQCANKIDEENVIRQKRTAPHRVRKFRSSVRDRAISILGAECRCCGETRRIFLVVDHIHGGGSREERSIGTYGIYSRIEQMPNPSSEYQTLCHNCNWAKYHSGGNCPHKQPSWMSPTWGGGPICEAI